MRRLAQLVNLVLILTCLVTVPAAMLTPQLPLAWLMMELNALTTLFLLKSTFHAPQTARNLYLISHLMATTPLLIMPLMAYFCPSIPIAPEPVIICSLLLKLGAPPLHHLYTNTINLCPWNAATLIMTWNKSAPIMLLASLTPSLSSQLIVMTAGLATTLLGMRRLLHPDLRTTLAYISMSQTGQLITIAATGSYWETALFLAAHTTLLMTALIPLMNTSTYDMDTLLSLPLQDKFMAKTAFGALTSLVGTIPHTGFFLHVFMVLTMVDTNFAVLALGHMAVWATNVKYYTPMITPMQKKWETAQEWPLPPAWAEKGMRYLLTFTMSGGPALFTLLAFLHFL